MAGYHNVNGDYNTLIGFFSGYNVTGHFNTYVGEAAGYDWYNQNKVNDGTGNTLLGYYCGSEITSGDYNTLVGYAAGFGVAGGNNNVIIGRNAGHEVGSGSGNVFIGYEAGYNEAGSSKLYIDNSNTSTPLIYGDFDADNLRFNANVGIGGLPSSSYKLDIYATDNTGDLRLNDTYPWIDLNRSSSASNSGIDFEYNTSYEARIVHYGSSDRLAFENGTTLSITSVGVGLGVSAPTYQLQLPNNSSAGEGCGLAYGWNTYSDKRIKDNFKKLPYGLNEVMLLNPLSYSQYSSEFKDNEIVINKKENKKEIGLVAQEVYDIIPEAVMKPENEEIELWSMNYDKLVPVLIKAIQEQQKMITELQEKVDKLEGKK